MGDLLLILLMVVWVSIAIETVLFIHKHFTFKWTALTRTFLINIKPSGIETAKPVSTLLFSNLALPCIQTILLTFTYLTNILPYVTFGLQILIVYSLVNCWWMYKHSIVNLLTSRC